eukprot:CAMPEP_0116151380 /NCGR_PEP_ID=MMETSP0329-20121206/20064_1 /TAXON_ID=697910 /ORGANISM="Pseudo-nitzschia arenysensis, Strain B593" /LENGTH=308 /DNA_ID=CAMNT_0003647985 /DNA_START=189 /DNA_END=1115 /DNA_ORIENTATION=-
MIWKRLFSPEGGNQMKRWMRFQQAINKKRWTELDRERNGPITLFDFSSFEDASDAASVEENSENKAVWRTTNDSIIGGYSTAKFNLVRTRDDYKNIMKGLDLTHEISQWDKIQHKDDDDDDDDNTLDEAEENPGNKVDSEDTFVPFVRWQGAIDTRVNKEKKVQRSGFCTIFSPEFPMGGVDLGGRYNGLEIMCRSDGRPYSLNLKVESFIADDLFQCFINIPPTIEPGSQICPGTGGKFDRVVFLFQHFVATAGGRLRARQRALDNSIKIQSIGITLMDGADGDFEFDLSRIRAVNYDESGVIGEVD